MKLQSTQKTQKAQKTLDAINIAAQDHIETGFRGQNSKKVRVAANKYVKMYS
jgi:hypothetical protein